MCTYRERFPRHIFPAHFVGFLFSYFCRFLLFCLLIHEMKAHTVCPRVQAYIFVVFWPFKAKKWPNC